MKIRITKANAHGNSFILINNISNIDLINNKIISEICSNYNTDGLIILNSSNIDNIIMDYYNNDGSWETLCVNGLLCTGELLNTIHAKNSYNIKCGDGIHKINKKNNVFEISMPKPKYKSKKIEIENIQGYYIDSGAKHFVIHKEGMWPTDDIIIDISKKIRYNKELFPDGINVNFFKTINKNTIEVKTYEKGIESLMNSCASGSFACAFHYHKKYNINSNINIINKGGEYISIFNNNYNNNSIASKSIIEYHDFFNL